MASTKRSKSRNKPEPGRPEHSNLSSFDQGLRRPVIVTLRGGFRHGEVSVEGQAIPRDSSGKGEREVTLYPPTVDVLVSLSSPIACTFMAVVEINGKRKEASGLMKHPGRESFTFQYPFEDFALAALKPGPVA